MPRGFRIMEGIQAVRTGVGSYPEACPVTSLRTEGCSRSRWARVSTCTFTPSLITRGLKRIPVTDQRLSAWKVTTTCHGRGANR